MENKLTLEHLAPYFPYGLKVSKLHTLHARNCGIGSIDQVIFAVNKGSSQYKPILRPLSNLTKEIEHNGEKFVPVVNLGWNSYDHILKSDTCTSISYEYMVKLFKWHFDVFGLIEKGLAIDINTIENA